ncbi:hypothetical protein D3C81_904060 [compost metagenome]
MAGRADGTPAELRFRPEQLRLAIGEAVPEVAAANADEDEEVSGSDNRLQVRVLHCHFEGTRWRLMVETDEGHTLYVLSPYPLAPNTKHTVFLPPSSAFIYASTAPDEERKDTTP